MTPDHIGATLLMVASLAGLILWILGYVDEDDDENDGTVDEDGWDRTPGQEPQEVGLP